jgi:hypothetical protein
LPQRQPEIQDLASLSVLACTETMKTQGLRKTGRLRSGN